MINDENHNFEQLCAVRTVNNCNFVEMPQSVMKLLGTGEQQIFNFVDSLMPLNLRKEAEIVFLQLFNSGLYQREKKRLGEKNQFVSFRQKWLLNTQNTHTIKEYLSCYSQQ